MLLPKTKEWLLPAGAIIFLKDRTIFLPSHIALGQKYITHTQTPLHKENNILRRRCVRPPARKEQYFENEVCKKMILQGGVSDTGGGDPDTLKRGLHNNCTPSNRQTRWSSSASLLACMADDWNRICLEVLRDLTHQALERQAPDQHLGGLLVPPDLTQGHGPRMMTMRVCQLAGGRCGVPPWPTNVTTSWSENARMTCFVNSKMRTVLKFCES